MEQDISQRLLTAHEVAQSLGVCPTTISRLRKSGKLKGIKFNSRLVRYRLEDVQSLITTLHEHQT